MKNRDIHALLFPKFPKNLVTNSPYIIGENPVIYFLGPVRDLKKGDSNGLIINCTIKPSTLTL